MFCKNYHLLISRNLDNDLNEKESIKLIKHLKICASCRKEEIELLNVKKIFIAAKSISTPNNFNILKIEKNLFPFKKVIAIAALFIFFLLTGFFIVKPLTQKTLAVKNNTSNKNSIINYPMSSIVYYDKKTNVLYSDNYYIPMSSYFSITESSNDNK